MDKKDMNLAKGIGIGMAMGAAATVAAKMMAKKNSNSITKGGAKAVRAVGDFMDGVQSIFK